MNPLDHHKLREAIVELRGAQQRIMIASRDRSGDWRREIVSQRRLLAIELGRIAEIMTASEPVSGAEESHAALRRSVSALRSALAEHQARWPAVSLDPGAADYRASVLNVRSAFDHLEQCLARSEDSSRQI